MFAVLTPAAFWTRGFKPVKEPQPPGLGLICESDLQAPAAALQAVATQNPTVGDRSANY